MVGYPVWACFDRRVPDPQKMTRDELGALVGVQAERSSLRPLGLPVKDAQIISRVGQVAGLMDANEVLTVANEAVAARLARLPT